MSVPIVDYIQLICSGLDQAPNKAAYIALAEELTSIPYFGDKYNYAVALRASHEYTLSVLRPDGEAGLITSKTDGRASVHYINIQPKGSNSDLHMTVYGKRLIALSKGRGPAATVGHPGIDPSSGIPASIYMGDD